MMNFELTIQSATQFPIPIRATLRRWVLAALESARKKYTEAVMTLRFVESEEGRALNREYRGKDYPTNVLTFVYENEEKLSGDIVLCMQVLRQEAATQNKTWRAHMAHLIVHGVLHLQGYDHENDQDAEKMEAKEIEILLSLGYKNPYAG